MNKKIKIAIGQVNPQVGSINNNINKIIEFVKKAEKQGVDLLCFPELAITGYPPEDLLLNNSFIKSVELSLKKLAPFSKKLSFIVGYPKRIESKLHNTAGVFIGGKLKFEYNKMHLPNYGVFDESRYFTKGNEYLFFNLKNRRICLTICEDVWVGPEILSKKIKSENANLLINLAASPFSMKKHHERIKVLNSISRNSSAEIAYCNLVGAQDELVFDGQSMFLDSKGNIISQAKDFKEDLLIKVLNHRNNYKNYSYNKKTKNIKLKNIFSALSLGLKDYVRKNGFKKVVIGISGGIDSALVAAVAVNALGRRNVLGVAMPTSFNSQLSLDLAKKLSSNLGFILKDAPIQEIFDKNLSYLEESIYGKTISDFTEENLQARIRANILMAISNKLGCLLISTGNKSEISVGYSTLYGDAAGAIAILKDIPKTLVYELSKYYNLHNPQHSIPKKIISRDPSAELRMNQKDSDSLPPYKILDQILELYIEQGMSPKDISRSLNIKNKLVLGIIQKLNNNEFKRRQAPLGIKITSKAFGRDRRYPVTNGFSEA
ncbi:NAD+ synthase [bacterium]|jgi:NAD+ synthase (glutamine-hydrolysing)|nr:NAD+ synthase [bacterium]MBT3850238.1 NAD+ synthase [bacterium]